MTVCNLKSHDRMSFAKIEDIKYTNFIDDDTDNEEEKRILPVVCKSVKTGEVFIYRMAPTKKVKDLKLKIQEEKGTTVDRIKVSTNRKEHFDNADIGDIVNPLINSPLEITFSPVSTPSFNRLGASPIKGSCMYCTNQATDHCSICGKLVCNDCGHWDPNSIETSTPINQNGFESIQLTQSSAKNIPILDPGMNLITQCPQCRAMLFQKAIDSKNSKSFFKRKSVIVIVIALIIIIVIAIISAL